MSKRIARAAPIGTRNAGLYAGQASTTRIVGPIIAPTDDRFQSRSPERFEIQERGFENFRLLWSKLECRPEKKPAMKRNLLKRLEKLERSYASSTFDYGIWYYGQFELARAAAVSKLTEADQKALTELFDLHRWPLTVSQKDRELWSRYDEAFTSVRTEMPISSIFTALDGWFPPYWFPTN